MHDEFPHEVTFLILAAPQPDGMGGVTPGGWIDFSTTEAFMDTPTSRQQYEAHQLNNPLDRNLFFPYRLDIAPTMRVRHGDDLYELTGRPQDQGGQGEIMQVGLRLVIHDDN